MSAERHEELFGQTEPLEFPNAKVMKNIPCSKCGRDVQVNGNTVMAFCGDCTKGMGQKK